MGKDIIIYNLIYSPALNLVMSIKILPLLREYVDISLNFDIFSELLIKSIFGFEL